MTGKKIRQRDLITALLICLVLFLLPAEVRAADKTKSGSSTTAATTTTKVLKDRKFGKSGSVTIRDSQTYTATESYTWILYTAKQDGALTISAKDATAAQTGAKGYLALYNSAKSQLLSAKAIYYNTANSGNSVWYKTVFGVQQDQSYYIRVKAQNAVTITASFKKIQDRSGAVRTTATTLKKNKMRTGVLPAGSSQPDWYQVILPKQQKLKLYYQAKTGGAFKLTLYSGTRALASRIIYQTKEQQRLSFGLYETSTNKTVGLNAGTYTVKIEKNDSLSSGYYKLKWK